MSSISANKTKGANSAPQIPGKPWVALEEICSPYPMENIFAL